MLQVAGVLEVTHGRNALRQEIGVFVVREDVQLAKQLQNPHEAVQIRPCDVLNGFESPFLPFSFAASRPFKPSIGYVNL